MVWHARQPRLLLVAGVILVACACGSTVQGSSTLAADPELAAVGPENGGSGVSSHVPNGLPGGVPTGGTGAPQGQQTATRGGPGHVAAGQPSGQLRATASSIPGVTQTTVTVGVIAADPNTDETFENAGFGAASLGNEPANWRAMADEINARGGIAGRRLSLVFHFVNLTDSPSVQGQAACAKFTEDNAVAAVVSGYYYASAHICLAQKGIPAFLGTNYGVDQQAARQSRTVVSWATPLLDRLASVLPAGFQNLGRLRAGTTAGIFVADAPAFTRSAAALSGELTRRGLTVITQTVQDSDSGDYSSAASDASAAVLRFRSAGVTEILFLTHNAFEPATFMQAANSQNYRPTYLLSSQQYPATLAGLVPASQLTGALGVGWAPAIDLSTRYDTSTRAQQCLGMLKKRGRAFSSGTQALAGLLACDGVDLLDRAAELPGGLTSRESLRTSARSSATGFVSAVTFGTSFPGGRPDGVDAYRPMTFTSGCGCFTYSGSINRM